ncbi:hypothetical protein KOR42_49360 [Thalassoglobus neptunius]|uniref:Uncharacterized protein n=1 Tax=Thalassoglobus neptunius TaxID=1938619 RepID=A0A5C5VNJ0_9PLAN|nr:hypothetical protein [Thalassoglobus neptunius]TWT40194.1 hypothetical protein KOR42_49360 [Thalassoglobus neptunius]
MVQLSADITRYLASPVTNEERNVILGDLFSLKKNYIQQFLLKHQLDDSGTKQALKERVQQGLANHIISVADVIAYLDKVLPWGKQHIYLLHGPKAPIQRWRNPEWLRNHLSQFRLDSFLNTQRSLFLPKSLQLSAIDCDGHRLRVTAVVRRDWLERNPALDTQRELSDDHVIRNRGFFVRSSRCLVVFEWDLRCNTGFLQISQLPTGSRYGDIAKEFWRLVNAWLPLSRFTIVSLHPAIKRLHELEEIGLGESRSHGVNYRTPEGRRIEGRSASSTDSLCGEQSVDLAMRAARNSGIGQLGNFYWLPSRCQFNPLNRELHTVLIGSENRINFPTHQSEERVRYVLSRIRHHCKSSS